MKKFSLALFALAVALAISPAAMADTFTYSITGTNFTADLIFLTGPANVANGVAETGAYTVTNVSGWFDINGGPSSSMTDAPVVLAATGAKAYNLTDNGAFLFDNLLYPGASGNGILDWGGVLIQVNSTYQINIFGGLFGGSDGNNAPGNGFYYFADNGGYHYDDPIYSATGGPALLTPEPGSLFLLGTGLLGLTLVIFRKAGKPTPNLVSRS